MTYVTVESRKDEKCVGKTPGKVERKIQSTKTEEVGIRTHKQLKFLGLLWEAAHWYSPWWMSVIMPSRQSPSATPAEQCLAPGNSLLPLSIHFCSGLRSGFVGSTSLINASKLLHNNGEFFTTTLVSRIDVYRSNEATRFVQRTQKSFLRARLQRRFSLSMWWNTCVGAKVFLCNLIKRLTSFPQSV